MNFTLFVIFVKLSVILLLATCENIANNEPIVGILSQKTSQSLNSQYPGMYKSYIAASYVKFVEGSGARAVPVWINKPKSYYEEIMKKLNGIIFPGGSSLFNQTKGYSEAGKHIYDIASKMNDDGNYFPLWGTCLGFELLTYLSADEVDHRTSCSSNNQGLHLDFTLDFQKSRMFKSAPQNVIDILKTEPVTANFHKFCVTKANLTAYNLDKLWRIMSTNKDWNGLEFISSIEHKKYPFYGVQFHPEKNIYEWVRNKNISHTSNAIKASQYFGDFFISESRKNINSFYNITEINRHVIYNFPATFTGLKQSSFEQCYLFPGNVDYGKSYFNEGEI